MAKKSPRSKGSGRVTPKGTSPAPPKSSRPPDRRTDATEVDDFGGGRPDPNGPHTGTPPTQRRTGTRGGR